MKAFRMMCAAVLSVLLLFGGPMPHNHTVHAETTEAATEKTTFVMYFLSEGEPEPETDPETQRRNELMYLMPSVVIAVVLTIMVMRQKMENRNRKR